MGATFPNGIASFKQHQDNLDAVEAVDVNKIQDELVAVEEALGDALTEIQDIEDEVDELEDEVDALQNKDTIIIKRFKNLKELIGSLWNGQNVYAATTSGANLTVKKTAAERPFPPGLVNLSKPDASDDPMKMWNGTGFTIKKSGLWVAVGHVDFNLATTGPNVNKNFGTYEASVTINGQNWTRALDRDYPVVDKTWHDVVLNPVLMAWLPKGTKLTLRAAQSSDINQTVKSAHLGIYRVRGR
jgi:cell division septum initiation protein DivIVA